MHKNKRISTVCHLNTRITIYQRNRITECNDHLFISCKTNDYSTLNLIDSSNQKHTTRSISIYPTQKKTICNPGNKVGYISSIQKQQKLQIMPFRQSANYPWYIQIFHRLKQNTFGQHWIYKIDFNKILNIHIQPTDTQT